jgi:hypothetical protein
MFLLYYFSNNNISNAGKRREIKTPKIKDHCS